MTVAASFGASSGALVSSSPWSTTSTPPRPGPAEPEAAAAAGLAPAVASLRQPAVHSAIATSTPGTAKNRMDSRSTTARRAGESAAPAGHALAEELRPEALQDEFGPGLT